MGCAGLTSEALRPLFVKCVPVAKKSKALIVICCFAALYGSLIKAALSPTLPTPSNPLVLYSNQNRDDLRLVLKKSFISASQSIAIWMYSATDNYLLHHLKKRADHGVHVSIFFDKKGGTPALPDSLHPQAVKSKGLMHRKI